MKVKNNQNNHQPAAEFVPVDSLAPWEKNPRKNEAAIPVVARSLEAFGFGRPLVAWGREGARRVVVGHTTLAAYRQLLAKHGPDWAPAGCPSPGLIPVRWRDDWTEAEAAGYAIADNKTGEVSGWDEDLLAGVLADLEGEIDLGVLGFEGAEIRALGLGVETLAEDLAFDSLPTTAPEFKTMTFSLSAEQLETVQDAIEASKKAAPFVNTGNENSNGNALARICEAYRG